MSHLFKASILLTIFFGLNKLVALARQTIIAKQFGFSPEIDAFNVANNIPDLVFSLFSGAALSLAFIPVFAEYIEEKGKIQSWILFSKTANIIFLLTLVLCIIFGLLAVPLVSSNLGIAPGFSPNQQALVVELMRMNLIAVLIFSISGLVMASLQAHKHFLLTALAPIFYNIGLIFGAVILAPQDGFQILEVTLPSYGMGIYGLVYGTILGATLHLLIQVPGLLRHDFNWIPSIDYKDKAVKKVFRLMAPRVATVFLIQFIFLARDNMASHMMEGSVTALTYGFFILQVPETLIGTAIATALLPTLSELASKKKGEEFARTMNRSIQIIIASTIIISLLLSITLEELVHAVFDFNTANVETLVWVTRGYLFGLLAHCLLEIVARAFYANHNATTPLWATVIRTLVFMGVALLSIGTYGVVGLALADSLSVIIEVAILLFLLYKLYPKILNLSSTLMRTIIGSVLSVGLVVFLTSYFDINPLLEVILALAAGGMLYLIFVWQEIRLLVKL